tara:strand:+ start:5672 stop:6514 length:843 start_codon:yes stop_codon:yes gene_type:complete
MIIWLASYPKSGNTLTRSILSSYFYSNDGKFKFENLEKIKQFPSTNDFMSLGIDPNNDEEVFKNFINVQNFLNKKENKINFLKTHSSLCKVHDSNFTDYQNSLGVIYIVRDPRNIVTSMANHYDISVNEATQIIIDKKRFLDKSPKNCSVFVGSWDFNFNSWKEFKNKNKYILIKYEDLINKKKTVFIKIFKFFEELGIKVKLDMVKLNSAIKSTAFEKMKSLEEQEDFDEAPIDKKTGKRRTFFNLGPKNDWRRFLDNKTINIIENNFKKEMLELGYLK